MLLELAEQQNKIVMTGVKERVAASGAASALTDVLRRSVENFIQMQQEFLKIAGRQTETWVEAAKAGKPFENKQWAELAREATENFIHAQKRFLDLVEETQKGAGKKLPGGAGKNIKKTELTEPARQAVEAFLDAEKKLFEVAGRQIKVNVQAVGKATDLVRPFPFIPLADLTRQGVKSYVDASKALVDVLLRRQNGHKPEPKPRTKAVHRAKAVRVKAEPAPTAA